MDTAQLINSGGFQIFVAGMWKLEVSHNKISSIPPMAFYGLERALWELHLNHNRLIRVPADSITLLKKLAVLNLAGKLKSIVNRMLCNLLS